MGYKEKEMKLQVFSDKQFNKKLLELALPITFQSLMLALVATADALMLGRVEQNAMAGVSLASQIQFVQNMILAAVITSMNILGAQYWGKKEKRALNDVFFIGLRFSMLTSILFFCGCIFFPEYLMILFTDEQVLIDAGVLYLKIAGWSYLLTGISQCYLALMKLTDKAGQSARISSITVVINIILNAIFIFGIPGIIPAMGVEGAAIATLIARTIEAIWSVSSTYKKGYFHVEMSGILRWNKTLLKDFNKNLLPLMGASLFWGIGFTSYTAFMGHLGTAAAAATSVATVIRDLICCMCNGISAAGGILVGNKLGAGELEQGKIYGDRLAVIAFICGVISSVIMLAFTPFLMMFVKLSDTAKDYLVGMMLIMAVYMIGRAVNTIIINGIFTAGGDTVFDVYSLAVTMWCLAVPLAAAGTFLFHWPVLVVYACTCLDEVGKIPWVMHHYKKYKWVKDLTRVDIN